jgi:MFS family permease
MIETTSFAAFQHRGFRYFQSARLLAMVAAQMQNVAIAWQVYLAAGRPLGLAWVGLTQFLPAFGLSLVAGHIADRFDRRRIVLVSYVAMAALSLVLFALGRRHLTALWPVYTVLVLVGTTRAFLNPASQALLPNIVPPEHFANAVAWGSLAWQVGLIAGPAVGGILLDLVGGPAPVYLVCAACSLGAFTLILPVRAHANAKGREPVSWGTLLTGVRYVWSNKVVLGAVSLDLFAVLFGGAVALLPLFARDILQVGPWGFGVLRSAPALGAALTAIYLALRPLTRRAGPFMLACVGVFGIATVAFGLSRSFPLSVVALFVVGASDMVSVYVRQTLVQLMTPDSMRGRVSAVNMVFIGASNELGEFESGVTAEWLTAVPAVVAGGIGTLLVVVVWTLLFPALRKVDRLVGRERA